MALNGYSVVANSLNVTPTSNILVRETVPEAIWHVLNAHGEQRNVATLVSDVEIFLWLAWLLLGRVHQIIKRAKDHWS
eukprot:scaffold743_cov117-Cylindrotheca_fusiformis.AAC.17